MSSHDLAQTITPTVRPPRRTPRNQTIVPTTANVRCKCQCPGGNTCGLDTEPRHTLHICPDSACWCHSEARYEAVR